MSHLVHRLGHFLQEDERPFIVGAPVEVHEPEDLLFELGVVLVLGDVLDDLADFHPLALDVVGVHRDELAIQGDGVAELLGVVDGEALVVLLELSRVALPFVADQNGAWGDVFSDEGDENVSRAAPCQEEGGLPLARRVPFDQADCPERTRSEGLTAVELALVEVTFVDLHNHARPAKDQLVGHPRPLQRVVDDVLEDRPVPRPGLLGDPRACADRAGLVAVADPLDRREELPDGPDLEQRRAGDDVGRHSAPGAEEGEVELLPGALCREDSVADMALGQGGNQADADEELPYLLVGTEAVGADDASDVPWQGVKGRRALGRQVSGRSRLAHD